MARPIKPGLDYFPIPVDFLSQRNLRRCYRKFGSNVITLYLQLLCDLYAQGYMLKVTDGYIFDVSDWFHFTEEQVLEWIEVLVDSEMFDKGFWKKERVLTSAEIQEQYLFAKSKSPERQRIDEKYKLVNSPKTRINSPKSTHSKV